MILHSPVKYTKRGSKIYGVSVNQKFGENIETYKKFGLQKGHNGVDFGLGNGNQMEATYGASIVAAHDGVVVKTVWDEPMSTKGNGVYVQYQEGDVIYWSCYWHLSKIKVKVGDKVKTGDVVGNMGNSGTCFPMPTELYPYNGTHLHFGIYKWNIVDGKWIKDNEDMDGAIDPMPLFSAETIAKNFNEYYEGNSIERISVVLYPIMWLLRRIQSSLKR
jgi:murein DD-endopeptidase MepM/ murein hydrolase activator NlpD